VNGVPSAEAPITGACRCRRVGFEITKPPLITVACHCSGCQRMTASAFSLGVAVPEDGFCVTAGETAVGGLHGAIEHRFCAHCMSWLFSRMPGAGFVNVRSALLDGESWKVPFVETWTDEKLPWAKTTAKHSFPRFPSQDAWGPMIREFQRSGGVIESRG
jgi:hypothetical protein